MIWGDSGDTKNRKYFSRENNANVAEFEVSNTIALKYHITNIWKNQ